MEEAPAAGVALNALIALAIQLMEQDEADMQELMLAAAQLMVNEIMDIEEDGIQEAYSIPITVDINEFHQFSNQCFKMHFRMSRVVFEALVLAVGNNLVQRDKLKRERTPLQDIILMVVWLMATPDSFRSVVLKFGVCPSTLYLFYIHVIEAL
ncbi:hypothetical protein FOCC_FOCC015665 [Frankliniella occidentalis]|nr:hypothetical protein FOCC_FOCC015665 [Frankliniella occidentalis]